MTKDKILERVKILEASREQVRQNLLAHEGAIQECNYWLAQSEEPAKEDSDG